jgi:hypothetical protein
LPLPALTPDEIVELLKRTFTPTIICEGTTDSLVYREIISRVGAMVTIIDCGGRHTLLRVYDRKSEFASKKVAFVADKDLWYFTGCPPEYAEVVFTEGYSIENDLIAGCEIERLLSREERAKFLQALDSLLIWYHFELAKLRSGQDPKIGLSVRSVIDAETCELQGKISSSMSAMVVSGAHIKLFPEYKKALRGKTLLELLLLFLSHSNRDSKYSRKNILEICCRLFDNAGIDTLAKKLRHSLAI